MAEKKIVSRSKFVDPSLVGDRKAAGTGSVYVGTKDADWFCNSCGNTTPINGNKKICPHCGNPKDKSENYVASTDDRPFLSKKDMEERGVDLDHGSDEECPYCQAKIAPKTEICPQCSGTIIGVGKTRRICPTCSRESNAFKCPSCGNNTVSKSKQFSANPPFPPSGNLYDNQGVEPKRTAPWFLIGGIIAVAAVIVVGIVLIFSPKEKTGTVASNSWTCSVPYEAYQYVQHSDWSIPAGGDFVSQSNEIHHYDDPIYVRTDKVCKDEWEVVGWHYEDKTVPDCDTDSVYVDSDLITYDDGTTDTINNYKDETTCKDETVKVPVDDYGWVNRCKDDPIYKDAPVYAPYYVYNIWEWVALPPLTAKGTDNQIVCPVVNESETNRQSGYESTTCETTFQVSNKQYSYRPDCSNEFSQFTNGSQWNLTMTGPFIKSVTQLP